MKYNEQIQLSVLEGSQAHERVREARAVGLPRIDMSLGYDRNWLLPSLIFNGNSVSWVQKTTFQLDWTSNNRSFLVEEYLECAKSLS